jgi:hypothetical protein
MRNIVSADEKDEGLALAETRGSCGGSAKKPSRSDDQAKLNPSLSVMISKDNRH